jgi:CRISPR-associated endonuclease/helicase Cas3
MMVTFVSQCQKNALKKTRRVLDAFADRIGDNTWQTVITEEGLAVVEKMLRQTASKNTAVACHWIRSRARSEFIWAVGNKGMFNEMGIVAVNSTELALDKFIDDCRWQTIDVIQYASAIAALFHDFGKANNLFQNKIDPKEPDDFSEPYRHEWVSMRLFQAFVGTQSDQEWLKALSQIERDAIPSCYRDGIDGSMAKNHPLSQLPPFAQMVAWLIVSHHKLPTYPKHIENSPPEIISVESWLQSSFDANWNSSNCKDPDRLQRLQDNWTFDKGLPVKSIQWRSKACLLASETLSRLQFTQVNYLHEDLFTTHVARLCLMMADHHYSSQKITPEWRNENYQAFANTDRESKSLKQKLDEHHIGVAHHASEIARKLPRLNHSLKQLGRNDVLEGHVEKAKSGLFGWQDKARNKAQEISADTMIHGFFGINMASTGTGKTQANAKIMYAIGKGVRRVRFSVALGLRTLTLQTGVEYQEKLEIDEEDLALLVGGQSVKQLFENELQKSAPKDAKAECAIITGSASQEPFLDEEIEVSSKIELDSHSLSEWTSHDERIEKLIQAPVLVSTIDHLVPATEGSRGGKQIAPMLRLLTSDLVLDEPDDFGLEDLPALCRLVHWAGMLGSRVLLSTATMPPALAYALFEAYHAGWKQYAIANIPNWDQHIMCAWFDDKIDCVAEKYSDLVSYQKTHNRFAAKRVKKLKNDTLPKRKGYIAPIAESEKSAISNLAKTIHQQLVKLHQEHHLSQGEKTISVGLVRMANVNPLVAVAKKLLQMDAPANTMIHYCVYHSRYPLAIRSHLESKLDKLLKRHDPDAIWQHAEIRDAWEEYPQITHHIFVVLASPVAEVGRDHDYDWAVVEPSSMRSIIQLAGRILRHRKNTPSTPNICLLNENYRALCKQSVCFEKPGFETGKLKFEPSHKLEDLLPKDQYEIITSIPKIILPDNPREMNLIGLEHRATANQIFGEKINSKASGGARVWWKYHPHWCGEVQRQQRFRKSKKDEAYYLFLKDEYSRTTWKWINENVFPVVYDAEPLIEINDIGSVKTVAGTRFWFDLDAKKIYAALAKDFAIELSEVSRRFGEIRLVEYGEGDTQAYCYHPNLGVYQEI